MTSATSPFADMPIAEFLDTILAGGSEALSSDRWADEAARGGCPPGEGAAFFLLRREADIAPGTTPLARLAGIGFAGGGDANAALRAALDEAGIGPAGIGRVFASPGIAMIIFSLRLSELMMATSCMNSFSASPTGMFQLCSAGKTTASV